ncbi:MAG: site-specific integrase [Deltaproteobacteria bacterium]|jgi:site-specific recombinase XerD|nr:site-specific integrase [Deltaproteobacteria bacterium]
MSKAFESYMRTKNLSQNTIDSYIVGVKKFMDKYAGLSKKNLLEYKSWLMENYSSKTVNLRLNSLNKYLEYVRRTDLKVKNVKIQKGYHLEHVISNADYNFLKAKLEEDGDLRGYFMVRFLAATGARVSEFIQLKAEHVREGFFDLYGKGGKQRRLYIPKALRTEALKWLNDTGKESGYLFMSLRGQPLQTRTVAMLLKNYARKYGIDPAVVYPHSFRHRYAKNFLEKCNDIALLADLMGHDSIETTRLYLRRTATEQRELVDRIVTW